MIAISSLKMQLMDALLKLQEEHKYAELYEKSNAELTNQMSRLTKYIEEENKLLEECKREYLLEVKTKRKLQYHHVHLTQQCQAVKTSIEKISNVLQDVQQTIAQVSERHAEKEAIVDQLIEDNKNKTARLEYLSNEIDRIETAKRLLEVEKGASVTSLKSQLNETLDNILLLQRDTVRARKRKEFLMKQALEIAMRTDRPESIAEAISLTDSEVRTNAVMKHVRPETMFAKKLDETLEHRLEKRLESIGLMMTQQMEAKVALLEANMLAEMGLTSPRLNDREKRKQRRRKVAQAVELQALDSRTKQAGERNGLASMSDEYAALIEATRFLSEKLAMEQRRGDQLLESLSQHTSPVITMAASTVQLSAKSPYQTAIVLPSIATDTMKRDNTGSAEFQSRNYLTGMMEQHQTGTTLQPISPRSIPIAVKKGLSRRNLMEGRHQMQQISDVIDD